MSDSEPFCKITQIPVIYEDNNVYTLQQSSICITSRM